MSEQDLRTEELRRAFLAPPPDATLGEGCFEPERILRAVLGELGVKQNRRLADHAATCGSCALAWKLAREFADEAELRSKSSSSVWRWLPAAAVLFVALVAVGVLAPWERRDGSGEPVLRAVSTATVRSLVAEGQSLPRAGFELRWSAGPEGARYDLRVTDRRLNTLHRATSIDATEYTVPQSALSELGSGSIVLWQVEMVLPDGRRVTSATFAAQLE
jgi:hypothetical protein